MSDRTDRVWMCLAIVLALCLSLTVAVAINSDADPTAQAVGGTTLVASAQAPFPVEVSLAEFAIAPAELSVPAGVPLAFTVDNTGSIEHDFTIEGVTGTETIPGGGTTALAVGALEPGSYPILCTIVGHEAAGMAGTLTVTEDGVSTAVATAPADGHEAAEGDHADMSPEEMARLHDEGVAAFPAETEVHGNQPMEPEVLGNGTLVFELTAEEIEWETKPGVFEQGMAYNGQIPGPQLHADVGDTVRIVLHNRLEEPTAIHSHGLVLPNDMDGVPGLTQPSILPGESFTYEFTLRNSGSHMYVTTAGYADSPSPHSSAGWRPRPSYTTPTSTPLSRSPAGSSVPSSSTTRPMSRSTSTTS